MDAEAMIEWAKFQQSLTGKLDADVSFVVPGKWPKKGDQKRLAGRRGPLGQCVSEEQRGLVVLFKADEVIAFLERLRLAGSK